MYWSEGAKCTQYNDDNREDVQDLALPQQDSTVVYVPELAGV